jgi:hypothetical protein
VAGQFEAEQRDSDDATLDHSSRARGLLSFLPEMAYSSPFRAERTEGKNRSGSRRYRDTAAGAAMTNLHKGPQLIEKEVGLILCCGLAGSDEQQAFGRYLRNAESAPKFEDAIRLFEFAQARGIRRRQGRATISWIRNLIRPNYHSANIARLRICLEIT